MICQRNNLLCCFALVIPVLFLVLGAHMFYIVLSLILTSRISLIFDPPLPMRDPHWLAGTTSRRVTGGLGTVGVFCKSCKKYIINWLISISNQFDSIYFIDMQYNSNMQKLTDENFLDGHHNFCLQVCHSISKSSHAYPFKNESFKIVSFQFWQKNTHGH